MLYRKNGINDLATPRSAPEERIPNLHRSENPNLTLLGPQGSGIPMNHPPTCPNTANVGFCTSAAECVNTFKCEWHHLENLCQHYSVPKSCGAANDGRL